MRRRHRTSTVATVDNGDVSIDLAGLVPEGVRPIVPVRPYAIIASIYNLQGRAGAVRQNYAAWKDEIRLISDGSTDRTVARLRQAGWRCFDDGAESRSPARSGG